MVSLAFYSLELIMFNLDNLGKPFRLFFKKSYALPNEGECCRDTMQRFKGKSKDFKVLDSNTEVVEDVVELSVKKNNVLDVLPTGNTKKKKCSSVCDVVSV